MQLDASLSNVLVAQLLVRMWKSDIRVKHEADGDLVEARRTKWQYSGRWGAAER